MKNINKIGLLVTGALLVIGFSQSFPTVAEAARAAKTVCRVPEAPTSLTIDSSYNLSWVNNFVPSAKESGYIVVQRSILVDASSASGGYWSNLYSYWTAWQNVSPKLSLGTISFKDLNPALGYPVKYRLVVSNDCGTSNKSVEISI